MKNLLFAVALTLSVLAFSSCGKDNGGGKEKNVIVAILKNGEIDYFRQIISSMQKEAENSGCELIVSTTNSEADIETQIAYIATLDAIGRNVIGIVFDPVYTNADHRAEEGIAEYASRKNVPVVIVDTPIDFERSPLKDSYTAFVGTYNAAAGLDLAKNLDKYSKNTLCVLLRSSSAARIRYDSFSSYRQGKTFLWEVMEGQVTNATLASKLKMSEDITDIVFFNGELWNENLVSSIEGRKVYAFDVYKKLLDAVSLGGVTGIMAQNTFEMGRQAVDIIINHRTSQGMIKYVPTIYVTENNVYSDDVEPFWKYFGVK